MFMNLLCRARVLLKLKYENFCDFVFCRLTNRHSDNIYPHMLLSQFAAATIFEAVEEHAN